VVTCREPDVLQVGDDGVGPRGHCDEETVAGSQPAPRPTFFVLFLLPRAWPPAAASSHQMQDKQSSTRELHQWSEVKVIGLVDASKGRGRSPLFTSSRTNCLSLAAAVSRSPLRRLLVMLLLRFSLSLLR
jgi:hypothetical protein